MVIKLSPWTCIDGYSSFRFIEGTDYTKPENRVAFIEKTPRVRLSSNLSYNVGINFPAGTSVSVKHHRTFEHEFMGAEVVAPDGLNVWIYGPRGSSDYGFDYESLEWCDIMLKLLGYEFSPCKDIYYICSECGAMHLVNSPDDFTALLAVECAKCGSKMKPH